MKNCLNCIYHDGCTYTCLKEDPNRSEELSPWRISGGGVADTCPDYKESNLHKEVEK